MEYTNQESVKFKWFDTKSIRNKHHLKESEEAYLGTFSFGVFTPFYFLRMRSWDMLIFVRILGYLAVYAFGILGLIYLIPALYISGKNATRLAWNRNGFKNFEDFKKSEDAWDNWGMFFFVVNILGLASRLGDVVLISLIGAFFICGLYIILIHRHKPRKSHIHHN